MSARSTVRIEPWSQDDLPLLEKLLGDPKMMRHLGGPEIPEKIAERQARYERADDGVFKIVDEATGESTWAEASTTRRTMSPSSRRAGSSLRSGTAASSSTTAASRTQAAGEA